MFSVVIFAQTNSEAQMATDQLVKEYELNEQQSEQMLVIQERQIRNLAEIEALKNTDIKKYRHKKRSIQQGTDASIRRLLTKDQMEIYQKNRLEWRKERANRIAELKDSGMTMEEIENTLLDEGF
jgi:hypothetical protein